MWHAPGRKLPNLRHRLARVFVIGAEREAHERPEFRTGRLLLWQGIASKRAARKTDPISQGDTTFGRGHYTN